VKAAKVAAVATATVKVFDYAPGRKAEWDDFVSRSKNGLFLFRRDYMDYHADRFEDASLMFADEAGRLVGLLPASVKGGVVNSHGGLTFGGVVSDASMRVSLMLELFAAMLGELAARGVTRLVYKAVPHIYHGLPAEEDLYALYRSGARLFRRDVSSTIFSAERPSFSKGRKWAAAQARKRGLSVERSHDFDTFMAIEEELLAKKYGVRPVHTAQEIALLAGRFPDNIKLFAATDGGRMLAGVLVYESRHVAHAQYISATDEGKEAGALDLVIGHLVNEYYAGMRYFDFGISTEDEGRRLNVGLIENKQGFGARAVVHDFYEIDLG
jgi:hypothetical protein